MLHGLHREIHGLTMKQICEKPMSSVKSVVKSKSFCIFDIRHSKQPGPAKSAKTARYNEMEPIYFKDQNEFRHWLEKNHKKEPEVFVGYHKVKTNMPSMSWSESVDQALCFGWIDGIRRSIDENRYCIRFTPRRHDSVWSNINIKKVEELQKKGLMKKEGLDIFNKRKDAKSGIYSFENDSPVFSDDLERTFKANIKAWEFFNKLSPSYKRTMIHWVMSAKQENTKISRLKKVISSSENNKRLY